VREQGASLPDRALKLDDTTLLFPLASAWFTPGPDVNVRGFWSFGAGLGVKAQDPARVRSPQPEPQKHR
jgi:hypothetical protein